MRLKNIRGRLVYKNCNGYRIDWDKKERSNFQTLVKKFLEPYLKNHIVYSEFPVFGSRMKIDIYDSTTKIAYEIQGAQHNNYVEFFAVNRIGFLDQIKRDVKKEQWCILNNIDYVEILESDLPLTKKFFLDKYNILL